MTEAEKSDRRSTGTAAIGVAILMGLVLVIGLGMLAFRIARSDQIWMAFTTQAPAFARGWIEDVRAGHLDEAYRSMTPAFRARLDREAFGRWVAEHHELKADPSPNGIAMSGFASGITVGLNGIRVMEPRPRMTHRTDFPRAGKGTSRLTITVVSEGGRPLVDQAEIVPEEPSRP